MHLPTIQTDRLTIRQFMATDWQSVYAYAADPEVMQYVEGGALNKQQAQEFTQTHSGEGAQAFAVLMTERNQLIGHLIFHPWFAPQTYEIGWAFHPAYHGQGFATEAARSILHYSFQDLKAHRVIATCQPENPASYRVMEKLGMRREGWFQQCIYRGDGVWWDELFYAILAEEWLATQ